MDKYCNLLIILLISISLHGQSPKELEIIEKINEVKPLLASARKEGKPVKSILKEFKSIAKEGKGDYQVSAVANALIGKALMQNKYHKEATRFCKAAYKFRKKEGDKWKQCWALHQLVDNQLYRGKYRKMFKYMEKGKEFRTLLREAGEIADDHATVDEIFRIRFEAATRLIEKDDWDNWAKESQRLLELYVKKFPQDEHTLTFTKESYKDICTDALRKGKHATARSAAEKGLESIKTIASPEQYADCLRYFATFFKEDHEGHYGSGSIDTEHVGIGLMHDYIAACKDLERLDQVVFSYRYIATRYSLLKDYQKAVQYLATAIKHCHEYNMEDQVVKSVGGLHVLISDIKKRGNKGHAKAAKSWKEGYPLEGLTAKDIKQFDEILKTLYEFRLPD